MKKFTIESKAIIAFLLMSVIVGTAQTASLNADSVADNTYELINSVLSPGYNGIEAPDVSPGNHSAFGRHIAEVYDTDLGKNVFEFYLHVLAGSTGVLDNDMSTEKVDRQRVEIKTYNNSPSYLKGYLGETVTYKWRFKIPVGFRPSSNFTHIHQVKPVDGDDSHPIFAITLRKGSPNKLEFAYVKDYSVSSSPTKLANLNLSLFEGVWVEVTETIKVGTGTTGTFSVSIKNVSTNSSLFSYTNNAMQTIRTAATDQGSPQVANSFIRPKWGIYRSVTDASTTLKDESIRFSDISISKGTSKLDQTISFGAISPKQSTQSDFSAEATASSGLAVSLSSSNPAVATIASGLIHIVGVGETTITATQSGDASYNAAPSVSQSLSVVTANNFVFRSLIASANWNTAAHWQNDSGNGTWVTSSVIPTAFNSVYIQSGHTVSVSITDGYCKDLHINTSGALAISSTYNVNVNGKIRAYSGTAVTSSIDGVFIGTSVSNTLNASMITTASTGVLKFVGSSRIITNTGEWVGNGTTNNANFELDSGAIGTLQTAVKFRNINIKSGTLSTNATINVGNTTTSGSLTIDNGAKLVSSRTYAVAGNQVFTFSNSVKCNAISINGTLELTGANPVIDCTSFSGTGTVLYSGGFQNLLTAGAGSGIAINTYNNLTLNGAGAKTFPGHDITVNNELAVSGLATLTVPTGRNLTVNNYITNNAASTAVVIESGANLNQGVSTTSNANTGAVTVKRSANSLFRLDYTMWSSPVSDQNLLNFSPQTIATRFYSYNPSTDLYNSLAPSTNDFATGNGYLIRMPDTDAASGYFAGTTPINYSGVFTGVPNNGDVSLGGEEGLLSDKYYAVGNPYPSTISANLFLAGNSTAGTLYFWRKTNAIANSGSAYSSYTTLGGTAGSSTAPNNVAPNGSIQVGQGFIVKTGLAATTLNFTNAMRTTNTDNQFFKIKNNEERSRIWLNLTNSTGVFSQMLLGYMTGASNDFDNGIDGKYIDDSPIALTSNIRDEEYTIQGRATPFDPSDVVALNFKTNIAADYTIGIDHVDGVFADGQDVFLKDNLTGSEIDLKTNSYSFTAEAGVDKARFSLQFQKTLKIEDAAFNDYGLKIFIREGVLYVNSANNLISTIKVFDVQGRLILQKYNINEKTTAIKYIKGNRQMLVVQVVLDNGKLVNKKIVN